MKKYIINLPMRLIVSPFILGVILIAGLRNMTKLFIDFMRYGGEVVPYKKGQKISEVYELLENHFNPKN